MRRGGGEWDTAKCGAEQEAVKSFSHCCWTETESRSWGRKDIKPYFTIHLALPVLMHMVDICSRGNSHGSRELYKTFSTRLANVAVEGKVLPSKAVSARGCSKQVPQWPGNTDRSGKGTELELARAGASTQNQDTAV